MLRVKYYYGLFVEIYGKLWFIYLPFLILFVLWPIRYFNNYISFDPVTFTSEWIKFGISVILYTGILKYIIAVRDRKKDNTFLLYLVEDIIQKDTNQLLISLNNFKKYFQNPKDKDLISIKKDLYHAWRKYDDSWQKNSQILSPKKSSNSLYHQILQKMNYLKSSIDFDYFNNCISTFTNPISDQDFYENDIQKMLSSLIDQSERICEVIGKLKLNN